ncbi:MAG TPA: alkaline phosphatase family protein [Myxococcota bacterium]|jgi:hypothetical protein|nr:alkaline phosphatase family protein [Myxococcota bacterium]
MVKRASDDPPAISALAAEGTTRSATAPGAGGVEVSAGDGLDGEGGGGAGGGRGGGNGGRAFALGAVAVALAGAALAHAVLFPRTFNGRPPPAVRVDPWAPEALGRGDDPPRAPSAAAAGARVALVVVDGLRDDAAAGLGLEAVLARDGRPAPLARCTARAEWPSYSRAEYAVLGTGAPPALSGVHTNRFAGAVELDSVFARARANGLRVVALTDGVAWWGEMFPGGFDEHFADAAAFLPAAAQIFAAASSASESEPARAAATRFDLALVHTVIVDAAGHESGAASAAYREAVTASGAWLRAVLARLDPARDTLVVVADHGHVDRGGHGGPEPEVLRVPLILAGRGVRPVRNGACPADARLLDVPPTVAALAGIAPPRQSIGRVLHELLELPPAELAAAEALGHARAGALARALGSPDGELERAMPPLRAPSSLGGALAVAALVGLALALARLVRGPRPRPAGAERPVGPIPASAGRGGATRPAAAALVFPLLAAGTLLAVEPTISFSAARHGAGQYAGRLLLLLGAAALVAAAVQRALLPRRAGPAVRRLAGALGVALACAPWWLAVGLHGSPLAGPTLGEPHLSWAVILGASIAAVGCTLQALFALWEWARAPVPPEANVG